MSALPLVISHQALRDLAEIEAYTTQNWGYDQATEYVDAIFAAMDVLGRHPELGMLSNRGHANNRHFVVRRHLIVYVPDLNELLILRVLHQRSRDPEGLASVD